jgi:hypothetical protein
MTRAIGAQQKVGMALALAPFDLVDLLLDFQRLQVVELGLVGLELGVELVLAILLLLVGQEKEVNKAGSVSELRLGSPCTHASIHKVASELRMHTASSNANCPPPQGMPFKTVSN